MSDINNQKVAAEQMKKNLYEEENSSADEIANAVDEIICNRQNKVEELGEKYVLVENKLKGLQEIQKRLADLQWQQPDNDFLKKTANKLERLISAYEERLDALSFLEKEFKRPTLNVGVSGSMGVGKSTTLQNFAGLDDGQIPTADEGLPVTAVRSEIYNSSESYALIEFKTEEEFLESFIKPHLDNINVCLPEKKKLSLSSVEEFIDLHLPETLGRGLGTNSTVSLKKLKEAQKSFSSYCNLLGRMEEKVDLDKLHSYVTYPDCEAKNIEDNGGRPAARQYLAVKRARVYCPFPKLGSTKICLIDRPGLGEVGKDAERIHLEGLEGKIDQVFLVISPTGRRVVMNKGIQDNLDELRSLYSCLKSDSDLIVIGNNFVRGQEEKSKILRSTFVEEINEGRDDPYDILDYEAINADSAVNTLRILLSKMAKCLERIDKQRLESVLAAKELERNYASTCADLEFIIRELRKGIANEFQVEHEYVKKIGGYIEGCLQDYEYRHIENSEEKSEIYNRFIRKLEEIHTDVENRINSGFFRGSKNMWIENDARVVDDYCNFFRNESKRLRWEIIRSYGRLDEFFEGDVAMFKDDILDILLLKNYCEGGIVQFDHELESDSSKANERIDVVIQKFQDVIDSADLEEALEFLKKVNYRYQSNVYLQMEEHLQELLNPTGDFNDTLGAVDTPRQTKIEIIAEELRKSAQKANNEIKQALASSNDQFNKYLSICASFISDYLYRKDEQKFDNEIVRPMVREYGDILFVNDDKESENRLRTSIKALEKALNGVNGVRY